MDEPDEAVAKYDLLRCITAVSYRGLHSVFELRQEASLLSPDLRDRGCKCCRVGVALR